jgi:hypothetical protein
VELLAERGIDVDHVTVYRWVQRLPSLLADAARFAGTRRVTGGSWMRPSAPRGALPYPQRSWEDWREVPGSDGIPEVERL